jgi:hypothetical protein
MSKKKKDQIPKRKLKNGIRVITVDQFLEDLAKMHGDTIKSLNHNEAAVDFVEILGDAKGEPDINPKTGNNIIAFSKPVLMYGSDSDDDISEDSEEGDSDNHGIFNMDLEDEEVDKILSDPGETLNCIARTLAKLRKLALEHINEEIGIQQAKGNHTYCDKLKEVAEDSKEWCIHQLTNYFVYLSDLKDDMTIVDEDE